jgi:hypothetical protein
MNDPIINDKEYVIVERKYFLEPAVYKYNKLYYEDGSTILVKEMRGTEGIVVINNIINNIGPDVKTIQYVYGRNVELIKLHHVKKHKEVIYSNGDYYVYSPGFRKFKKNGKKRVIVNVPESYKEYDEWIEKNSTVKESKYEGKNAGKDNAGNKNNESNSDKNKGNNGDKNKGNYGDKNKGNNDNKNSGNNSDMNSGNDTGNKNKGKENGNKSNSKDKGSKNNGKNDKKDKK